MNQKLGFKGNYGISPCQTDMCLYLTKFQNSFMNYRLVLQRLFSLFGTYCPGVNIRGKVYDCNPISQTFTGNPSVVDIIMTKFRKNMSCSFSELQPRSKDRPNKYF